MILYYLCLSPMHSRLSFFSNAIRFNNWVQVSHPNLSQVSDKSSLYPKTTSSAKVLLPIGVRKLAIYPGERTCVNFPRGHIFKYKKSVLVRHTQDGKSRSMRAAQISSHYMIVILISSFFKKIRQHLLDQFLRAR